jgi:drug/metabolite transporter (DMT)-like permease
MTSFAVVLILIAAVLHATWNYWAKRAGGGLPFVYLVSIMIVLGYIPVVTIYLGWRHPAIPHGIAAVILISGVLKTGYSLYLQRGYRTGDFSLIYPLARGTGPLLSTLAAIAFLGERPSLLALAGGFTIIVSIFWLTGGFVWIARIVGREKDAPGERPRSASNAARYGITSGVFIAAYTLWDRHGVAHWLIPPLLYDAGTALTQFCLLTPFAWGRRAEVLREWKEHRFNAFVMATVSPVAYILVLTAMTFTRVSYVAPAREVSILIGTFFGAKFLKESDASRRIFAAIAMVFGIVALALG